MTQEARATAQNRKKNTPAPAKVDGKSYSGAAFQSYNSAVQLLQQGKYDKAIAAFEKLLADAPIELKDRCKIYIITCQRQLEKSQLRFETPEEHYDYAVSKLNTGY